MKPSASHRNRQPHNWLVYDDGDRFLEENIPYYRGVLCDLGCGEAPYRAFFQRYASRYVGVDWTASLHQTRPDIVADMNRPLPIASGVVDTVVSISVLEHLCEPQMLLNEAHRILKPGGALILQVPWQWQIHEAPYDFFRYTPYGLRYMLTKAGFQDVEIAPQSGFFSMWFNKFNYFSRRALATAHWRLRPAIQFVLKGWWYVSQKAAPFLDRLDTDRLSETTGYAVRARKP